MCYCTVVDASLLLIKHMREAKTGRGEQEPEGRSDPANKTMEGVPVCVCVFVLKLLPSHATQPTIHRTTEKTSPIPHPKKSILGELMILPSHPNITKDPTNTHNVQNNAEMLR